MTLDVRGLHYIEIFDQIRDVLSCVNAQNEDIDVFVDANEFEKCIVLKGFVENLMKVKTDIEETCGFYILKIVRDAQTIAV